MRIVRDRYTSTQFEKISNWGVYLIAVSGITIITYVFEFSIISYIFTGLIILETMLILVNTPFAFQMRNYIRSLLWIIMIYSLFIQF